MDIPAVLPEAVPLTALTMLALRVTVVLASALVAARWLRSSPPRVHHLLWTTTFLALLALPLLPAALPELPLPIAGLERPGTAGEMDAAGELHAAGEAGEMAAVGKTVAVGGAVETSEWVRTGEVVQTSEVVQAPSTSKAGPIALALWGGGALLAAGALGCAMARSRRLIRSSRELCDPAWRHELERLQRGLGLQCRVRLLTGSGITTPMAGGILRPAVLLPEEASGWGAARRTVVLTHELVHLRHRDPLRHVLARVALALYWFHPLAWLAARRAMMAREQACDAAVLANGTLPSIYARQLLELAEAMTAPPARPVAALPMIQRSLLEKRLMAILSSQAHRPRRLAVAATVGCMTLITLSVAAAQPVARTALLPGQAATPGPALPALPVGAPAPAPPLATTPQAVQAEAPGGSACWWDLDDGARIGTRNGNRVIQTTVDGTRLCLRTEGDVRFDATEARIASLGPGGRVLFEARRGDHVQSLEISAATGGESHRWFVDGTERPYDETAQRWKDRMLSVTGAYWQISHLRGQVSSLRGEISSIRGHRSSLHGQISSARGHVSSLRGQVSSINGHVSSLRGQISSARGHVSSLQGEISSINGHVSSLRGVISSERGAISGLNAGRYRASEQELRQIDELIAGHEARIAEIEREIETYDAAAKAAEVEQQIAAFDLEAKVADIEQQIADYDAQAQIADIEQRIADYDLDRRVQEIEAQIEALDVDGKVAEIDAQIEALDVDRRTREIEERLAPALEDLQRLVESIR